MPPFIPTITLKLKLGAGSSVFPDNFDIEVFEWDINTNAVSTSPRVEYTGVTKTQLDNLGVGYTVSGIIGTDYKIKATSTGTCTTSTEFNIYTDALSVYQPITGILTEDYSGNTDYHSFSTTGGGYLSAANVPLATIQTLSYIDPNDFSISYLSGTTFDGMTVITGDYANGPFSGYDVQQILVGPPGGEYPVFKLYGAANTSLQSDPQNIHGFMRLTYTPSGNSVDFNFFYVPYSA